MNQRIIRLQAENVKRLRCVSITPDGNMVVIGGKNGAGKSSCIDSIMYALAGGKSLPKVPVRRGEEKATVELDLGDLIVKRVFTSAGGTSLQVTNKHGLKHPSPQTILDALVGKLSFDPLEFARGSRPEDDRRRSETIRALVGLDLSKQDAARKALFDERTMVSRDVRGLESRLSVLPKPMAGGATEEVSTESILKEQQTAAKTNSDNQRKRVDAGLLRGTANSKAGVETEVRLQIESFEQEVLRIQQQIVAKKKDMADKALNAEQARQAAVSAEQEVAKLQDIPLEQFTTKLRAVEQINIGVRERKTVAKLSEELKEKQASADALTTKMDGIDKEKHDAIASAKFPVDGLSVAEDGEVMFNGLPFSQASSAEQLRVSVAIGLALNPKLRVLLIRDGSLLDEDGLKLLAELAEESDGQIWLERVSTDGEVSVVIEDGMISAQSPAPKETAQRELKV